MMSRLVPFSLALGLVAACASPAPAPAEPEAAVPPTMLAPHRLGSLQGMHSFQGLLLAGQPKAADLEEAKASGVRTVVDLRTPGESRGFDERATVAELGLEYRTLPWNGPEQLTDAVFDESRAMFTSIARPALVHCGSANRVGAVWIPWRVLDGGLDLEAAVAEARTIGLKTAEYEAKARDYVARHAQPK